MAWLLCKAYFFLLLIMVVYTESDVYYNMTSMTPDLSDIEIKENQTLRITCISKSKIEFSHLLINLKDLDSSTPNISEYEGNGVHKIKLQINQTVDLIGLNINRSVFAIKIGEQSNLKCYVKEVSEPKITWYKNNVKINTATNLTWNDVCKYEFSNNNQELQIGYFDEKCIGNYYCKAENYIFHIETYELILLDDPTIKNIVIFGVTSALIITTIILIYIFFKYKKEKNLRKQLMEGCSQPLNPKLTVNEQVDLLGYDKKKWEFSRDKLKLGKILGRGHIGVVIKAEAHGIYGDDNKTITTVAVKMLKKSSEITNIQALANELKIMIYMGKHENIVNLLGACTKNIAKRELSIIVEYCHFGNLHDYLIKHRLKFINQIDSLTGKIDISKISITSVINVENNNNNEIKYPALSFSRSRSSGLSVISDKDSIEMSNNIALNMPALYLYPEDCLDNYDKDENLQTICTQDLFSWSLQVAKGMDYLSQKKVFHGDLAARNILLAENNIVKISDFDLAKNICSDGIYIKTNAVPVPFKWVAIDSLKSGIFTTQSDVWSFGIVLWEFFSLAETPYPEMGVNEYYSKVFDGYRMKKPKYATNEIYNIMLKCWLEDPTLRPTFTDLVDNIGNLLDNIDKKDNNDLNTQYYVDIKKSLDDGTNNDSLIMNPAPVHPISSPSSNDYASMNSTNNINIMNSTNRNDYILMLNNYR